MGKWSIKVEHLVRKQGQCTKAWSFVRKQTIKKNEQKRLFRRLMSCLSPSCTGLQMRLTNQTEVSFVKRDQSLALVFPPLSSCSIHLLPTLIGSSDRLFTCDRLEHKTALFLKFDYFSSRIF